MKAKKNDHNNIKNTLFINTFKYYISVSGKYIKITRLSRNFLLRNMIYIDSNWVYNNDNDEGRNIFVENKDQSELPSCKQT